MLSVGIYGATGYMGAPFSRALTKAHREGLLRFVILHRPKANVARYPADIEKRCIDAESGDVASVAEKVKDLQVVMYVHRSARYVVYSIKLCLLMRLIISTSSAVTWQVNGTQYRLIDALKGSKQLVTFFPCEYATPHTAEDLTSPFFTYSNEKKRVRDHCVAQGIPYTFLANATTPELLFNFG